MDSDDFVVIANEQLPGQRSVVHKDSLPGWELRGWVPLGPAASTREAVTVAEVEAAAAEEAAHVAEVMSPEPKRARKTTSPSKSSRQASAKPKE